MPEDAPPPPGGPLAAAVGASPGASAGPPVGCPDPALARARRLLSFALLATLAVLKAQIAYGSVIFGPDGAYYLEVARNVRDAAGLVSWISMYHAGVESFPYPTPIYPLWPLLLGYVGRVVPIEGAAAWLPTLLSFGAVVLLARHARALWPRPLLPDLWDVPDAGHLAVLVFGFNPLFLEFSSQPYTEALGFFVLFWTLERARPLFAGDAGFARAVEVGAYAGLLILVRAQMFLFTLVLVGAFALAVLLWRPRRRWAGLAVAAAAGWALALAPQFAWLTTFYPGPLGLGALLRFERFQPTELLPPVKMLISIPDPIAYLRDRAVGFELAFRAEGKYAYAREFGHLQWAPFLALAGWLPVMLRRGGPRSILAAVRSPAAGPALVFALLALGGFFSIHTLHKTFGATWNFGTRHALTVIFLFGASVVAAAARPGLPRVGALVLLTLTLSHHWDRARALVGAAEKEIAAAATYRPGLVAFLARERDARGRLTVVSEQSTRLAWELPGVGFHWFWARTRFEDVEALFVERAADYLVVPASGSMDAIGDPRFASRYVMVHAGLSGMAVYRRDPDDAARRAASAEASAAEAAVRPDAPPVPPAPVEPVVSPAAPVPPTSPPPGGTP